jgi:membrane protein required for colicin V production
VNLLDVLLVVIIGGSLAAGWMAGFARVGIGFIATVCGLLFGFWFYGIPAAWIHQHIHSEALSNLLGFLVVLAVFHIAGALVGKLLSMLFKWTGLSWLDRLAGGAFGAVRGALISIALVAVLLAFTPRPVPNWMVDSQLLPYAIDGSDLCASLAPRPIKDAFREAMTDIRKAWDDQFKKKKRKSELQPQDS